jgi:hypothetical protein
VHGVTILLISVGAAHLASLWEKMGIIPKEKVISMFNNKSKRSTNKQDLEMISIEVDSDASCGSASTSDSLMMHRLNECTYT